MAWAWWTLSGALALAAAWALIALLVGDRARGRRRCPKCWHSMEGLPERDSDAGGWTCPECGRAVRRERDLFRTRRRRSAIALAGVAALALAAWYGRGVYEHKSEGWRAWMPTTPAVVLYRLRAPDSSPSAFQDLMTDVVRARARTTLASGWHQRLFHWSVGRSLDDAAMANVDLPDTWVVGEPIPVVLYRPRMTNNAFRESVGVKFISPEGFQHHISSTSYPSRGQSRHQIHPLLGRGTTPALIRDVVRAASIAPVASTGVHEVMISIDAEVALPFAPRNQIRVNSKQRVPIRFVGSVEELVAAGPMRPVRDPSVDAALRPDALFSLSLVTDEDIHVNRRGFPRRRDELLAIRPDVCLAFDAELLRHGRPCWRYEFETRSDDRRPIAVVRVVTRTSLGASADPGFDDSLEAVEELNAWVRWYWGSGPVARPDMSGWSFRITPRPLRAFRRLEYDAYWVCADGAPSLEYALDEIPEILATERLRAPDASRHGGELRTPPAFPP